MDATYHDHTYIYYKGSAKLPTRLWVVVLLTYAEYVEFNYDPSNGGVLRKLRMDDGGLLEKTIPNFDLSQLLPVE